MQKNRAVRGSMMAAALFLALLVGMRAQQVRARVAAVQALRQTAQDYHSACESQNATAMSQAAWEAKRLWSGLPVTWQGVIERRHPGTEARIRALYEDAEVVAPYPQLGTTGTTSNGAVKSAVAPDGVDATGHDVVSTPSEPVLVGSGVAMTAMLVDTNTAPVHPSLSATADALTLVAAVGESSPDEATGGVVETAQTNGASSIASQSLPADTLTPPPDAVYTPPVTTEGSGLSTKDVLLSAGTVAVATLAAAGVAWVVSEATDGDDDDDDNGVETPTTTTETSPASPPPTPSPTEPTPAGQSASSTTTVTANEGVATKQTVVTGPGGQQVTQTKTAAEGIITRQTAGGSPTMAASPTTATAAPSEDASPAAKDGRSAARPERRTARMSEGRPTRPTYKDDLDVFGDLPQEPRNGWSDGRAGPDERRSGRRR